MYVHHSVFDIYKPVDCFICPSRNLKNKMAGRVDDRKLFHLTNFITEIPPFAPFPIGGQTVVYFGRLSREKGLPTLLKAVKGLAVRCLIIGEGPERAAVEKFKKEERLDNVTCLGYLQPKQVQAYIRQAAFTVLPSEWYENSPRAVLESFALGRAVVSSRIGGLPELVIDEETGLTFEAGNAHDLREKIVQLLDNPRKAEELGRTARRFVQAQLGAEDHYQSLMKIFEIARHSAELPGLKA